MSSRFRPGAKLEGVPLFPLPHVVLFPGALLPLHVFELRYRAMIEDCLEGSKLLSVVHFDLEAPVDEFGHPPISEIAGVGEVIQSRRLPNGRYDIVVAGRARVRLAELPFNPPYRRADLEVLQPTSEHVDASELQALRVVTRDILQDVRATHPSFELSAPSDDDVGRVVDWCAHYLILDRVLRQRLLETLDVGQRLRLCLEGLLEQRAAPSSPRETN